MMSVVIPCYNESSVLEGTVATLHDILPGKCERYEIILVIERSPDDTLDIAKELERRYPCIIRVLENDRQYGKGYSVRKGISASKGDLVLVVDADLPVELRRYLPVMLILNDNNKTGAVYATAISDKSDPVKRGVARATISYLLFGARRWLMGQDISDSQLGCKLYRGDVVRSCVDYVTADGYLYDFYLTDLITASGFRIEECTVRIEKFSSKSSVNPWNLMQSVVAFARYMFSERKKIYGVYNQKVPLQLFRALHAVLLLIAAGLLLTGALTVKAVSAAEKAYQLNIIEKQSSDSSTVSFNQVWLYAVKKTHPNRN
ncbi:MAG: glycosyltransferase [Eubacteriales bacterium]